MQTNMQSQQNTMPEPPNVISTKDHLYLKDMMSWNLNAMKKAYFFSGLCQDPDVKTALDQTWQMHANHYQKILSHLQNTNQQQPGMQSEREDPCHAKSKPATKPNQRSENAGTKDPANE